jgi:pimeloyl-ACP methyl ester carboxylesterase
MYLAMQSRWVQRELYSIAVVNQATLTDDMLDSFAQEHLSTALRWQRLRRFFDWQLDPVHSHLTMEAVPAMRQFTRPILILWGEQDTNFGPAIGKRLARDIPGTRGIAWMADSAHLPMLEQPDVYRITPCNSFIDGTVNSDEQAALELARR